MASKSQRRYYAASASILIGAVIVTVVFYFAYPGIKHDAEYLLLFVPMVASFLLGMGGIIHAFLSDPILGMVSFDSFAVTVFTPAHEISFSYSECAEIGFTTWAGSGGPIRYIFMSKKPLTDKQKKYLLWDRSRKKKTVQGMPAYKDEYVLFQYTPELFVEFIKNVPEPFRSKLIEDESQQNPMRLED